MVSKGQISRLHRGKYELKIRHGVKSSPPRIQNLVVVASGVPVSESAKDRFECSHCRITVSYGVQRGKITYRVSVPLGLDVVGLSVVHGVVCGLVEDRGYSVPEEVWMVRNLECLNDFSGFRLEGLTSASFVGVSGELEKYYNREGVRREIRASPRDISLTEMRTLLTCGVDSSSLHREHNDFFKIVDSLGDAVKGQSRLCNAHFQALLRLQKKTEV